MARAEGLRLADVRNACRLIGECRDLGSDPALWYPRLLEGLCDLIGASSSTGGEGWWLRPHGTIEALSGFHTGLDSRGRAAYAAFMREIGPAGDPTYLALQHAPGPLVTRPRRQLVSDAMYYQTVAFNEYLKPANVDYRLVSLYEASKEGAISAIELQRGFGERDFSPRDQRLLNFFHEELGRLIGRSLVSGTEPRPEKLSRRLRQTLECLVEGDSEKQVAARLGLSFATTHQYVTALYRHFGVQSRAQLLVHVIQRLGRGQWRYVALEGARPMQDVGVGPGPSVSSAVAPRGGTEAAMDQ